MKRFIVVATPVSWRWSIHRWLVEAASHTEAVRQARKAWLAGFSRQRYAWQAHEVVTAELEALAQTLPALEACHEL